MERDVAELLASMPSWVSADAIGKSAQGREIVLYRSSTDNRGGTLLIGGIHGNEPATIFLLDRFLQEFHEAFRLPVDVIPLANPDGFQVGTRYNARGVDLNRNFGTGWRSDSLEPPGPAPWSEPESRCLRDLILKRQPACIVALHWALAEIEADGPQSVALAEKLWSAIDADQRAPYRLRATPSVATAASCPGSLGQWCGYGVTYPDGSRPAMVTLELPHDPHLRRPPVLPEGHLEQVRRAWAVDPEGYLAAVGPAVYRTLEAACRHRQN
ncbi:MAG TPA: M14 family zinc carboxypeptidase [Chthoniobacteraceae bacterium]|nr:M14 family zinc carboxypeptidase [Chthoniobacteraceae bacterium]